MFNTVNKWFFKPGARVGTRCVDACYSIFAYVLSSRTKYTGQYTRESKTLRILSPDPLEDDDTDERNLGRLDTLITILPAVIGIAVMEYLRLAAKTVPGTAGMYIELLGIAVLYILAAGSLSRLNEVRVEIQRGDTA